MSSGQKNYFVRLGSIAKHSEPYLYRVQHQPSGLVGDWLPLNRSIICLPKLTSLSSVTASTYIHGTQLDLIDAVDIESSKTDADSSFSTIPVNKAIISQCGEEQCLEIKEQVLSIKLQIKLHWIDDRMFNLTLPTTP